MIPSPQRSPAPRIPAPMATARTRGDIFSPWADTNPRRAKIPPSPWLSARRINDMYLMLTTMVRDQKMRDMTPIEISRRQGNGVHSVEAFPDRIKRARPDIPENNPQGPNGQPQGSIAMPIRLRSVFNIVHSVKILERNISRKRYSRHSAGRPKTPPRSRPLKSLFRLRLEKLIIKAIAKFVNMN